MEKHETAIESLLPLVMLRCNSSFIVCVILSIIFMFSPHIPYDTVIVSQAIVFRKGIHQLGEIFQTVVGNS